jgi:glutathione synthase
MMTIELGVVMDPIKTINFKKDSTLAMLDAARRQGWSLHYMEQSNLFIEDGRAMAIMRPLTVRMDPKDWFTLGEPVVRSIAELDVVLMRKDPPFNNEFVYTTYILEAAEREGCLIVNKPQSLRDCNEKVFATQFPQCCPPLVVSKDAQILKQFYATHHDVIYKPLDGMGGSAIFRVQPGDPNLSVIIEMLTGLGNHTIMAQRYIPDIVNGDKRILMIDGEPVDYALARIPQAGETRGNLAAGGRGEPRPLTERDRWICAQVGPTLRAKGLLFVGLDVIGDYLTEINVTSPTCIRELDNAHQLDIGGKLIARIGSILSTRTLDTQKKIAE